MGESGHHPLFFEACKLAIDFYGCLENTERELLSAAFHKQIMLGQSPIFSPNITTKISQIMREEFVDTWETAKASLLKLEFYNEIKRDFEPETYLGVVKIPDA